MLIRNAEVWGHGLADVRIEGGEIAAIMPQSPSPSGQALGVGAVGNHHSLRTPPTPTPPLNGRDFDATGGALLPGLHDHHIHLAALAARSASVWCGPPEVCDAGTLADRLLAQGGTGWLRGIGYHESVMGLPSACELDAIAPDRPLRIQHRSGRMWLLNSCALAQLLAKADPPPGLERDATGHTGRLFDEDQWLRETLASEPPDFAAISAELASYGITGVTDMSPRNDPAMAAHFAAQMRGSRLLQQVWLAGAPALADAPAGPWRLGPAKLHLHESALPDFDEAVRFIAEAHERQRAVAIHCVSEVELVFALAAIEQAGAMRGDRIEHASVASDALIARIASLGLQVCVQPQFVAERGDQYLADVEPRHHAELYRLRAFAEAGVTMAGGSDAPFISADPWVGMASAVARRTGSGAGIGLAEALSPEAALALYLADPEDLSRTCRIAVGEPADMVLLSRPWAEARSRLSSADVRATIISGNCVYQAPA